MARVLIVGKYYPPFAGGIEANTAQVAEALAARRHKVTALVNNHAPGHASEERNGVRVERRRVDITLNSQPISMELMNGVDPEDYDLVHFHAPNPFASALLLSRLKRRKRPKLFITHHMDITGRPVLRQGAVSLYHQLVRQADGVIVTSEKNAMLSKDLPRGARHVVVPLGVEPAHYTISDAQREMAQVWRRDLVGDARTIAFVGRHARYKGLDVLIDALALLPGYHALIAGDGAYRVNAQAHAAARGVADRAHFFGVVDFATKRRILAAADVFALPSTETTEAFGISQIEAMVCGVPVVASNLPTGVTDCAIDGVTALLAPPRDAAALARAIQRMVEDRALAMQLAAHAQANVLERMTLAKTSAAAVDMFEGALGLGMR